MNSIAQTTVSGMRARDWDSLIPMRGSCAKIMMVSCSSWLGPVNLGELRRGVVGG